MTTHRFVLNGRSMELDPAVVTALMFGVVPEDVREHGVQIGGRTFPVKQVFEIATGLPRAEFTSHIARRHLAALGLQLSGSIRPTHDQPQPATPLEAGDWPWEGRVQALFIAALNEHGWQIDSQADTATKAHGIDITGTKHTRRLGAEVKGWPSASYADPKRAGQTDPARPTTQAAHWFSQALFKAMMLRDSHPDYGSLIVLPGHDRYRDRARRTQNSRAAADIHTIFVQSDGTIQAPTWQP
jgi:hypothetical protein